MKCKWGFLETQIQSVQRGLNLLFQRTLFLMFPHFQKYLNPLVRTKEVVNSVLYHPCPSRLASGIGPLNSFGFYLSRMLSELPLTCIFQHVWKNFSIYVFHIFRKSLNHAPVHQSKLLVEFFENLFLPRQKGWEEASYDLLCQN